MMHKKLLFATALLMIAMHAGAQTKLIHYWHFNNFAITSPATVYYTPNLPTFKANYSTIDTNKAVCMYSKLPGTSAAYTSSLDPYYPTNAGTDTPFINWNSRLATPAGNSLRVRNPSDSMMLTFGIPTTHYKNIVVKFATESSSATSGMKYQLYDYSVDSGLTWRTTALSKSIDTTIYATYDTVTVRFADAADTMVRNNPKLIFRIRFSGQNTGTSGNNRFDNFTVDGDTSIVITRTTATNVLLHYWHYNNFATTTNPYSTPNLPTFKANYSRIDTNKAICSYTKLPGTSAAYTSMLDAYLPTALALDTPFINWNSRMGVPAGNALRVRNPSDSMMLTFGMPTTHYKNIVVKFATESSSATSGMKTQLYDYSVDSGLTWRTTALSMTTYTTTPTTFDTLTIRFNDAADTMVKNNPKLIFRIRFSGQNTGTSGNNRFDNVTVDGDTLTSTSQSGSSVASAPAFPEAKLYPNPASTALNLDIAAAGNKVISIYAVNGQHVATRQATGTHFLLDIQALQPGIYSLNIRLEDGRSKTMLFVKQ